MASVIRGSDNFDSVYAKPKAQCTAWVNFNGTTTPPTIRDSYNVSSIVRTDTGTYDVYFTTPMDNTSYTCIGEAYIDAFVNREDVQTDSVILVSMHTLDGSLQNADQCSVQIFGGKN